MATQDDFADAREQDKKLKGRFTGALEQYGSALRDQPGRLLRAQQIGEQRLRAGTQSAIAGAMNTGPLGAGALGGMADVGLTRAQQEAQFQTASEQALADARMRAAQGEAEIAGLLQETGSAQAIRKHRDQIQLMREAGIPEEEVQDYINTELGLTSDPQTQRYLKGEQREYVDPDGFFETMRSMNPFADTRLERFKKKEDLE